MSHWKTVMFQPRGCGFGLRFGLRALLMGLPVFFGSISGFATEFAAVSEQTEQRGIPVPDNIFALDSKLSCGPRCVQFMLKLFERGVPYDDVLRECSPGPHGTSLKQLQDCLTSHGLHVLPLAGPVSEAVKQMKQPMIARLESKTGAGHFVVIVDWDDQSGNVLVYNPPAAYGRVPAEEFGKSLSGIGLVVSDHPLPSVNELVEQDAATLPLIALTGCSLAVLFALIWKAIPNRIPRPINQNA